MTHPLSDPNLLKLFEDMQKLVVVLYPDHDSGFISVTFNPIRMCIQVMLTDIEPITDIYPDAPVHVEHYSYYENMSDLPERPTNGRETSVTVNGVRYFMVEVVKENSAEGI